MSKSLAISEAREPDCPICGGKMKYRAPDTGLHQVWTPYWYCLRFPDCKGMIREKEVESGNN